MNIKSLFFTNGEEENKKKVEVKEETKVEFKNPFSFTQSVDKFESTSPKVTPELNNCEPHMASILKIYEEGLERLNMPGYDFFEFYKAINQLGTDNPNVYQMAFTMAKTMDDSITKETLLSQSQYYVTEITKVHKSYIENGQNKKQQLIQNKENEETSLKNEINSVQFELQKLNDTLTKLKLELNNIENKNSPLIKEIDCKIMANDVAKDKTISSIEAVVNGIINNVK